MAKKIITVLITIIILFTFTSCGMSYHASLDENLHNQVEFFYNDDDGMLSYVTYRGEKYNYSQMNKMFGISGVDDSILLSWNGYRYIYLTGFYYSYTTDKPLFIYGAHLVFFHEDYDYYKDAFVIENTDDEIVFEDMYDYIDSETEFNYDQYIELELQSKYDNRIYCRAYITYINGELYISNPDCREVLKASDEFINILKQNAII